VALAAAARAAGAAAVVGEGGRVVSVATADGAVTAVGTADGASHPCAELVVCFRAFMSLPRLTRNMV
jgi:hypothetical protein